MSGPSPVGSIGIPTNTGGAATTAAVNAYFDQQGWTNQTLVPVNPQGMRGSNTTFVDEQSGTVVTVVGQAFDKGVFKIKDILQGKTDEVLIGTGTSTKVTGTDQGNVVTIIDDANHLVRLGAGDDVITNLGAGGGTFRGMQGADTITGGSGNELIYGGVGQDVLQGGGGNDQIFGGRGADVLSGGTGDDLMKGGLGRDVLTGGAGNDTMTGGKGHDTFVFGSEQTGRDVITDFHKGDTLNLLGKQQAGITFEVNQVVNENGKTDTELTFSDGSKITLQNVKSDPIDLDGDGFFNI